MGAVQTTNPSSFETVWAALQEVSENQKETDRQMKEYNKRFGEFTNHFGEVVEYMIAPNFLILKFFILYILNYFQNQWHITSRLQTTFLQS